MKKNRFLTVFLIVMFMLCAFHQVSAVMPRNPDGSAYKVPAVGAQSQTENSTLRSVSFDVLYLLEESVLVKIVLAFVLVGLVQTLVTVHRRHRAKLLAAELNDDIDHWIEARLGHKQQQHPLPG